MYTLVEYKGFNEDKDQEIIELAKKYKGKLGGSGMCFDTNTRDMEFSFSEFRLFSLFRRVMRSRKLGKVKEVQ